MYARYVPPAKGPKAAAIANSSPAQPQASPERSSTTPAAPTPTRVGEVGFSYARYVPGSKAVHKPVEQKKFQFFDDEPAESPSSKRKRDVADVQASATASSRGSKKFKSEDESNGNSRVTSVTGEENTTNKDKNSKKPPKSDVEDVPSTTNDDPENPSITKKIKKDKKDKKAKDKEGKKQKKHGKEPEQDQDQDEDNDQPAVHKEQREDDPDTSMADVEDEAANSKDSSETLDAQPVKEKKESKRKKEKKSKQVDVPEEQPAEEDEEDRRHKMVMERKEKSLRLAGKIAKEVAKDIKSPEEPQEVHELGPLPQPAPAPVSAPQIRYETLPPWLASPVRVSQDTKTPFSELGVLPKATRVLEERGYPNAFAVQTAAIPRLLPSSKHRPGDVLISAATGSGKTLAYSLPIVRDISQTVVTRLRALVVLPTRELVKQAQEAFELCAKAYEGGDRKRARVGIAIGSQTIKSEQENLIEKESRYDPEQYQKINAEETFGPEGWSNYDTMGSDPRLGRWENEVVDFSSKVDVLICTPGRLVEHIEQSPGFSLDYVRWLVVDEADKLLAQSFQGWLEVVLEKFKTSKWTAREATDMNFDGVRKVVLSATLTRDLSLLNQLALRRPELIVLESEGDLQVTEHALPVELEEFAIRVHDINLKPLYLLDLLKKHMNGPATSFISKETNAVDSNATSDTSSDDSSDTSSDDSSDTSSDDSSDTSSDSDSDSDSEVEKPTKPKTSKSNIPISLIFTKSNEAALRLSRLLTLLDESLSQHISTLTSTTPTHIRRKTLQAFMKPSSPIRLIIASDLVARGIDLPNLDNVINYDIPPSVAAYVHRVGRTARAGRSGRAWTLVGDEESGWFWGKIAKGTGVRRAQKVERTRVEEMDEDRIHKYEAALEKLGQEALETKRR